jgi:type III secretion system FlhB-like substrate exporter
MIHTAQALEENNQERPILIVDREGKIGESLVKELKEQALVVYVSGKAPEIIENVVHVLFDKQFPTIPDNNYSHIFIIDENFEIAKDIIKPFLKKAEQDKAFLVLAVNANFVENSFSLDFVSSYDKAKIVIMGDIFKNDSLYNSASEINKYIVQIKTSGRIDVPGDGTRLVAPVLFNDVIFGILETVFGTEENKIFYLFPKHRITLLSLAHIFQRLNPDLKIDFIKDDKASNNDFNPSPEGKYLLGDDYNLDSAIKNIRFESIKIDIVRKELLPSRPKQKRQLRLKSIVFSLLLLLLFPLLATIMFAAIGGGALLITKNEIEKGDLFSSITSATLAMNSFNLSGLSLQILAYEAKPVGLDGVLNVFSKNIELGQNITSAVVSVVDASGLK